MTQRNVTLKKLGLISLLGTSILLSACSSDDGDDTEGFIKFYNASSNSPAIYLTVDEDLDEDEEDEVEITFSGINYGIALNNQALPTGTYFYELAWQDEDSRARSDLEIVFEDQIQISEEEINLVVMHGDIQSPDVTLFPIEVIDEEDDLEDDLFNLRFLNVASGDAALDIYMSKSDETFNEAVLMGSVSFMQLSDNNKLDEDQYIFYITNSGSTEIMYQSPEVDYPFTNQYIVVIRDDSSTGNANFIIDNVGPTGTTSYQASDAQSSFRMYNGVQQSDLLPDYSGQLDYVFEGFDGEEINSITNLQIGEFSDVITVDNGDFSVDVIDPNTNETFISRQLISLEQNTDKTIFYYTIEVAVDDDGDGDVDEDGDGQIDEKEVKLESVVVENSTRERIYDHEVEMLNLSYSEDFDSVTFYFVKSDENISTTDNVRTTTVGTPTSMVLRNNTYDVFAVAEIDGTETILDSMVLILDETSNELFMLLEPNINLPSGYGIRVIDQIPSVN